MANSPNFVNSEPLLPRHMPVEIPQGTEALALAHASIENFRNFAAGLPLGPQTRTAYDALLHHIASQPDRVQLFRDNQFGKARLVHENIFPLNEDDMNVDATIAPDAFIVELTPSAIEGQFTHEILDLGQQLGIPMDRKTALQLAYAHVLGHELGHGIQQMYKYCMPSSENMLFPTPLYQYLERNTLSQHIAEEVPVPAKPRLASIIESERFAEGIGQDFVVSEMVRMGLVAADDHEQIAQARKILYNQRRHEQFARVQQIVDAVPAGDQTGLEARLREAGLGVNVINYLGYGMAHDRATIDRILAITP